MSDYGSKSKGDYNSYGGRSGNYSSSSKSEYSGKSDYSDNNCKPTSSSYSCEPKSFCESDGGKGGDYEGGKGGSDSCGPDGYNWSGGDQCDIGSYDCDVDHSCVTPTKCDWQPDSCDDGRDDGDHGDHEPKGDGHDDGAYCGDDEHSGGGDDGHSGGGDDDHGGDKCDPSGDPPGDPEPHPDVDCTSVQFVLEGPIDSLVTITEVTNPDTGKVELVISIAAQEVDGVQADLRGVFFDIGDESLLSNLVVTGADVTDHQFAANSVDDLGNGANVKGELTAAGKYDAGVEIGTQGIGADDISSTTFVLSVNGADLTLADFCGQRIALRYTSVDFGDGSESGAYCDDDSDKGDKDGSDKDDSGKGGDSDHGDSGSDCNDGSSGGDSSGRDGSVKVGGLIPTVCCSCHDDTATLFGRYFCDTNNDNLDNGEAEPGVAGKVVFLLDSAGNIVDQTETDAEGNYSFTGLAAGTYRVAFQTESDKSLVAEGALDANNESIDPTASDVDPTQAPETIAGVETVSTGDMAASAGDDVTDVDVGVVAPPPPASSISGTYFCDADGDDLDNDGVDVAGKQVFLLDGDGNLVDQTITDAIGDYLFTGLHAGDYSVAFELEPGKLFVAQGALDGNNESLDPTASDVNPVQGLTIVDGAATLTTGVMSLGIGENKTDVDIGVDDNGPGGSAGDAGLGDFVFLDTNGNGIQDVGENGIQGVTVLLLDDTQTEIGNTTTDENGYYEFTSLNAGDYYVQFLKPETAPGSNVGLDFSPQDQGVGPTADEVDSDADPLTGVSHLVTLSSGEFDSTIDAGLEYCLEAPDDGSRLNIPADHLFEPHFFFKSDVTGHTTYNATTDLLSFNLTTPLVLYDGGLTPLGGNNSIRIGAEVDQNGIFQGGAGNVANSGFDFVYWKDTNGDDIVNNGEQVVLTANILALGSDLSGADNGWFDALLEVTGGTAAADYSPLVAISWIAEGMPNVDDYSANFMGNAKVYLY